MSRRVRALSFSLLVLAVSVAAGEGVCRSLWREEEVAPLDPANVILKDDATLFWVQRPGINLRMGPHFSLQTNSLGLRNEELSPRPAANTYRILSLGESSTWGASVDLRDTYSKQLQALLNGRGRRPGAPTYEVVNAGVGAYSVWQSHVYLRERGVRLAPHMVLVYHLKNDRLPRGVVDRHNYLYTVSTTDRELYERRARIAPVLRVLYQSRLYFALRRWSLLTFMRAEASPPGRNPVGTGTRVPDEDRRVALEGLLSTCQAHGIQLVVVKPVYGQAEDDELLAEFAAAHDLPFVDLPAVKASGAWGNSERGLFNDLVHPSADGHRLIAGAIYAALERQGVLAEMVLAGGQ